MIRVYKDVDKTGILETVKTIHANAGEISAVLANQFEELQKCVQSDKFKEAAKIARLIAVGGKAGNLETARKIKLLAKGLIERLKKIEPKEKRE